MGLRNSLPHRLFLIVLFYGSTVTVSGQLVIHELSGNDPVYRQHQELVASFHRATAQGARLPPLLFLTYRPKPTETLYDIASRLMLPYSTIVTLNRLSDAAVTAERDLIVPTHPGIFIYETPQTSLESQLSDRFRDSDGGIKVTIPEMGLESVSFYPGSDFLPSERKTFLQIVFDDPLTQGIISSVFGYRNHPITGIWSHHNGVDLAADFGAPVRTAAAGRVSSITRDPWLGLSVTIDHRNEYQSRYAHLQEVFVSVGTIVGRGDTIGTVGSTGLSTGPHLHFEILYKGENRDPIRYLPRETP